MIRSRRAAITASLIGALLVAGVPTLAFGEGDTAREAKAYSAESTSDDIEAQKAKNADEKKADKNDDKKATEKKNADKKGDDKNKKVDEKKAEGPKKDGDQKSSDRRGKDNDGKKNESADRKRDHDKREVSDKEAWKRKKHNDKRGRDWDYSRDRDRHRRHYGWDTNRRWYDNGYYGAGWYDDCGYYGPNYNGYGDDYYYYGPDACGYEYGGYGSHMLVNMSWEEVIPDPNAGGSGARGAYGTANLDIDVPNGVVCYRLAYDGIDRAIGAQIHPGRRGEVGPALVLFRVGENGDDGCVRADPRLLSEIQNDPRGYYLEVNDQELGQAMRGQLDAPDYRNRY